MLIDWLTKKGTKRRKQTANPMLFFMLLLRVACFGNAGSDNAVVILLHNDRHCICTDMPQILIEIRDFFCYLYTSAEGDTVETLQRCSKEGKGKGSGFI